MIGVALSGGGSRAIAFHLGCLRALNDLGILDDVAVISTISGGSVIGAYYAYSPQKSFAQFEDDVRRILRKGFHHALVREALAPWNVLAGWGNLFSTSLYYAGLHGVAVPKRYPSRTDLFRNVLQREVFGGLQLGSPRRNNQEVVVGACELRTGSAFRFSNRLIGGWRHGRALDGEQDLAFAVAASAAYPLLLPALDRSWTFEKEGIEAQSRILLTDGGVYDNLGVQVLEPSRTGEFSLHTFQCDYLIVCSAGHGQESGEGLPMRFFSRIGKAFAIVHRRVQDSTMRRLHHLREGRLIKGFALPYLGQQDDRLPYKPADLVSRSAVIGYPTDFASMPDAWIDLLSARGEQLTRLLVPHYLPDICR
jgi:NTE family protein